MRVTNRMVVAFLLMSCCLLSVCGCDKSAKAEYFSKNLADYEAVAEYVLNNCKADKYKVSYLLNDVLEERYVVNLSEIDDVTEIKSSVEIAQQDFSYVWIENSYVVFWNDETKTIGLLYSENPKKSIKAIKTWYTDIESEKLNDNCYIIGQLWHI